LTGGDEMMESMMHRPATSRGKRKRPTFDHVAKAKSKLDSTGENRKEESKRDESPASPYPDASPSPGRPEDAQPKNYARNTDGTWARGNSAGGKPKGCRHRATLLAEALIDGKSTELINRAVDMALAGDASVMRALLDRICPPRKERPVSVDLPLLKTPADLIEASSELIRSVADGEIVPGEAAALSTLVANVAQAITAADLAERLTRIEAALAGKDEA
jgi:hypothetical protein